MVDVTRIISREDITASIGAATNLVAFVSNRPGRAPASPPGFRTGVQYLPPHYRIGQTNPGFTSVENMLTSPTDVADRNEAVQHLAAAWRAELAAMDDQAAAQVSNVLFMTSVIEPP